VATAPPAWADCTNKQAALTADNAKNKRDFLIVHASCDLWGWTKNAGPGVSLVRVIHARTVCGPQRQDACQTLPNRIRHEEESQLLAMVYDKKRRTGQPGRRSINRLTATIVITSM
jgi:hypothetical protein